MGWGEQGSGTGNEDQGSGTGQGCGRSPTHHNRPLKVDGLDTLVRDTLLRVVQAVVAHRVLSALAELGPALCLGGVGRARV